MNRKDLQAAAKAAGIKANQKSDALVAALKALQPAERSLPSTKSALPADWRMLSCPRAVYCPETGAVLYTENTPYYENKKTKEVMPARPPTRSTRSRKRTKRHHTTSINGCHNQKP